MIQLFEIKKKIKKDNELLNKYSEISKKTKEEVLKEYNTSENGITENKATELLEKNGPNVVVKNEKKSRLYFLFNSFKDKFIIILIVLAVINYFLSDALSTYIILGIAVISALIRYFQDYSVYKFNQELKAKMYTTTNVVRGGKEKEIRVEKVVPGDIVHLSAGSMIPADIMLIDSKDLFVNQSVFTGESVPVEKVAQNTNDAKEIFSIPNICLMGSSVVSGRATGVVIDTGFTTYLGRMSKEVETKKEPTNFEKGMNNITKNANKIHACCFDCSFRNIWLYQKRLVRGYTVCFICCSWNYTKYASNDSKCKFDERHKGISKEENSCKKYKFNSKFGCNRCFVHR